jgi:hypothetical protein
MMIRLRATGAAIFDSSISMAIPTKGRGRGVVAEAEYVLDVQKAGPGIYIIYTTAKMGRQRPWMSSNSMTRDVGLVIFLVSDLRCHSPSSRQCVSLDFRHNSGVKALLIPHPSSPAGVSLLSVICYRWVPNPEGGEKEQH